MFVILICISATLKNKKKKWNFDLESGPLTTRFRRLPHHYPVIAWQKCRKFSVAGGSLRIYQHKKTFSIWLNFYDCFSGANGKRCNLQMRCKRKKNVGYFQETCKHLVTFLNLCGVKQNHRFLFLLFVSLQFSKIFSLQFPILLKLVVNLFLVIKCLEINLNLRTNLANTPNFIIVKKTLKPLQLSYIPVSSSWF